MENSILTINKTEERLNNLFIKRFNINMNKIGEEYKSKKLLGREIGMAPRDLLYLFFDVENEFGIVLPQNRIANGEFDTYNDICKIVHDQLENHT